MVKATYLLQFEHYNSTTEDVMALGPPVQLRLEPEKQLIYEAEAAGRGLPLVSYLRRRLEAGDTMQGELVGYRVLANDRPAEESVTELRLDDATLKVTVAGAENMLTQMTDANGLQAFEVTVPVGAS